MAPHSSTLAWKIQGPGEPGGLPSVGSHRVEHDWSDLTAAATVSIIVPNHNHFVSDCGVGGRGVSAGSRLYERESWTWPLTSSVSFFIFTIMTIIVFITESLWRSRSLILFTHTHTHTQMQETLVWFLSWKFPWRGTGYPLQYSWASPVAQTIKNLPAMLEAWVWSLGWEDPLEEGMATHSSILAWRIPTDRGAWWATVHGVTKTWTWLSN